MTTPLAWRTALGLLPCLLLTLPAAAQTSASGQSQAEIAGILAQGSYAERDAAHQRIRRMPVGQREGVILRALIDELDRETAGLQVRRRASMRGEPVTPLPGHGRFVSDLVQLVSEHDDPTVIQPLLPYLGTGTTVINVMVGFGERAVRQVAEFAGSSSRDHEKLNGAVTGALIALEIMLAYPLSEAARALIVGVAQERLYGTQQPAVVVAAVDLALATGDELLLERVEALASDTETVRDFQFEDPALVTRIQERAVEGLVRMGQ